MQRINILLLDYLQLSSVDSTTVSQQNIQKRLQMQNSQRSRFKTVEVERREESQITRHRTHYLHLIGPIPSKQWLSDVNCSNEITKRIDFLHSLALGRRLRDTVSLFFFLSLLTSRLPLFPPSHKFIQTNSIITFSTQLPLDLRFIHSIT